MRVPSSVMVASRSKPATLRLFAPDGVTIVRTTAGVGGRRANETTRPTSAARASPDAKASTTRRRMTCIRPRRISQPVDSTCSRTEASTRGRRHGERRQFFDEDDSRRHVGESRAEVFLQAASQQNADRSGNFGRQPAPVWLAHQHGSQCFGDGVADKRARADQHLVEHAPEGPDIGPLVHGLSTGLLGAHVGGGAENHTGLCHRGCCDCG